MQLKHTRNPAIYLFNKPGPTYVIHDNQVDTMCCRQAVKPMFHHPAASL